MYICTWVAIKYLKIIGYDYAFRILSIATAMVCCI